MPCRTGLLHDKSDDITQCLLGQHLVDEAHLIGDHFVEERPTTGGLDDAGLAVDIGPTQFDEGVQVQLTFVVGDDHFLRAVEGPSFSLHHTLFVGLAAFGNVVKAQYHVLARDRDRCAVRR